MKSKKIFTLLFTLCSIIAISLNVFTENTSALSANWLSAQTTYRWNTSGNWTSVVKSITTGPAQVAIWNSIPQSGINYLQFRILNISGTVSPAQTGDYYSGDFNMQLHFSGDNPNFNFTGGFNCDWIADVRIQPEVGTVVQHTDSIKACRVQQTNLEADIYLTVSSSGKLSQSSSVSSYLIILRGLDPNGPFFSAEVSPSIHYYLTLMPGDINFTVSTNASTSGLGEVNQSINNVNNQLQEMNDKDQQDRDNISNTSEEGEEAAQDAGDAAANKGQTLLQAFGSLIGALSQVHETNCKLPNMQVYSLQLNDMDMCAVSLPTAVSGLLGVGICMLIVLLGIKLVKRMLALYKEITG